MSKPLFAYLFLGLVEEEKLDLDTPLVDYLGADYLQEDPRHRRITARMTLNHTSGLPNWRAGGWRSGAPLSLGFDPGAQWTHDALLAVIQLRTPLPAPAPRSRSSMGSASITGPIGSLDFIPIYPS